MFRSAIPTKLTSTPCGFEMRAQTGPIDAELRLYMVNIYYKDVLVDMLFHNTSIDISRPGSRPFGDYQMAPRRAELYLSQRAFYSGYFHIIVSSFKLC